MVEFAVNNTPNGTTGYTAFYLNYGFHPLSPAQMLSKTEETNNEAVHQFTQRLQQDFQAALQQLIQAGEAMKRFADRRRREEPVYRPGDLVLLSTRYLRMRDVPVKLQRRFVGPSVLKPRSAGWPTGWRCRNIGGCIRCFTARS